MIRKVTDLRWGLTHPRRDWDGRFMSRRAAARVVHHRVRNLDAYARDGLSPAALADVVRIMNEQAER